MLLNYIYIYWIPFPLCSECLSRSLDGANSQRSKRTHRSINSSLVKRCEKANCAQLLMAAGIQYKHTVSGLPATWCIGPSMEVPSLPVSRASAIARHRSASLWFLSSATSEEKDSNSADVRIVPNCPEQIDLYFDPMRHMRPNSTYTILYQSL